MSRRPLVLFGAGLGLVAATTMSPVASRAAESAAPKAARHAAGSSSLAHVGTFHLQENLRGADGDAATSAEIIAFSSDRRTLLYTDAFTGRLGFIDTTDPGDPQPAGALDLPGDPTSVAVTGHLALVAAVTSVDPDGDGPLTEQDRPSGELVVVDVRTRKVVRRIDLAGQPDSVAVAPSDQYAAVAIENERDEDEDAGLIPQHPPGLLQVVRLRGGVGGWTVDDVDLTGLADIAPEDPEPEYVDINHRDQAVVSLQGNNHLAVVDLRSARVVRDFPAGRVDVDDVDATEEEIGPQGAGVIALDDRLRQRRREPDAVHWVDEDTFATANEGDYVDASGAEGGSRSFTLFHVDGTVEYEAGASLEHHVVQAGHYPESRSENKGSEPEGVEVARHRGRTYLFVAAERANIVAVYEMVGRRPVFRQLVPTGIGPEGLVFEEGVLAVSAEVDGLEEGFPARPLVTFYTFGRAVRPAYPMLASARVRGLPIPWVAQSGLAGDPHRRSVLWSVSDSALSQAYLYRIDARARPARIVERIPVGDTDVVDLTTGDYDLEGVAVRPEGGFWLASEGRVDQGSSRPNLVLRAGRAGRVLDAIALPAGLSAGATSSGLEGIAVSGTTSAGNETVYVAFQREWADDAPGHVKIGRYDVATATWTFAAYPLGPVASPAGGWVGLSELTLLPDGRLAVLERDNQLGLEARLKRLYAVDPASVTFKPHGETLPLLGKALVRDALPDLAAASISVPDKAEGVGLTRGGRLYLVTDNDGVEASYGETVFLRVPGPGRRTGRPWMLVLPAAVERPSAGRRSSRRSGSGACRAAYGFRATKW